MRCSVIKLFSVNPAVSDHFRSIDLHLHNPEFEIIDETDAFLVVNKPAHLLVYPTKPDGPTTLFDELSNLLRFELTNGGQISIINRLDRETSGIVLIAKTKPQAHTFSKAMQNREFDKTYEAIVWGWPEEDSFEISEPLLSLREVAESPVWVKQAVHPKGKASVTNAQVLKRFERKTSNGEKFSHVRCRPETGRMHQIRVHLSHVGFPIVGDKIYGPDEQLYIKFIQDGWTTALQKSLLLNRHALHASQLEWRDFRWEAELPQELAEFAGLDAFSDDVE